MRMERSICTPRYRSLVSHSTSCPQNLSFCGMIRCWPVRLSSSQSCSWPARVGMSSVNAVKRHGDKQLPLKTAALRRPGSQNLSSIRSRTFEIAMLIFNDESRPYRNGCRYLAPLNDYRQRLTALPS
ncbi:hypothetical protein EVAR_37805_1 [Eumeta japonica]|uniref:Uncharacterized protein n=1 Tax=Eumeta variegata TaxID=151549 RepID=A0A4C1W757_EUMVA|nr:hypothetical protein EVAR_37805_1 [Eumeta japonica]